MPDVERSLTGIITAAPRLGKSAVRYSELCHFESAKNTSATVGIKLVMRGNEHYQCRRQTFDVAANSYLLLNPGDTYSAFLAGKEVVTGLCIDLDPCLLQQVNYLQSHTDEYLIDNPVEDKPSMPVVMEGIYKCRDGLLDNLLFRLGEEAVQHNGCLYHFTEERYYALAWALACMQHKMKSEACRIGAKKPAVQKELYARIAATRDYMHEHFMLPLTIDELAKFSLLSPFHFIRTFRQAFSCTPYQYIIELRLQHAQSLIKIGRYAVTEVSDLCGFCDVFTFSKAFKRRFGIAPSFI